MVAILEGFVNIFFFSTQKYVYQKKTISLATADPRSSRDPLKPLALYTVIYGLI